MFILSGLPSSAGPFGDSITYAAQVYAIDPELIAAHIMAESSFNPNATHTDADGGVSYGLMQMRLDTAQRLLGLPNLTGAQLLSPQVNIVAGAKLIQQNLARFGSLSDAIAAYNAGVPRKNAAGQYINSQGDTGVQNYVDRVMGYYSQYKAIPADTGIPQDASVVTTDSGIPPAPAEDQPDQGAPIDYTWVLPAAAVILFAGWMIFRRK